MKRTMWIFLLAASVLPAQQPQQPQQVERRVMIQRNGTVQFMSSDMFAPAVKGAPYSGKTVTETTQVLADGNRIQRTTGGMIYRDSEGRTRREQSLAGLGPLAPAEPMQSIVITDPVEGATYMLDQRSKTAHKSVIATGRRFVNGLPAAGMRTMNAQIVGSLPAPPPPPEGAVGVTAVGPNLMYMRNRVDSPGGEAPRKEDLGVQMVEGVRATGSRIVMTIPAGEIGNERPIEVVSETWYSPELQVVVMSKHNDPRMGETVYKLTEISRAEPPRSMFEVPADYTVNEPPK